MQNTISLTQQLRYYGEYQTKIVNLVGKEKANSIISGAIHLLSAGTSDFIQNYYINPLINRIYSPARFSDLLMNSYSAFVEVSPNICTTHRQVSRPSFSYINYLQSGEKLYDLIYRCDYSKCECIQKLKIMLKMIQKRKKAPSLISLW